MDKIHYYMSSNELSSASISLYEYNGGDYIYVISRYNGLHDNPNTLYDCDGNAVFNCGGLQQMDPCLNFFKDAKKIETLWSTD